MEPLAKDAVLPLGTGPHQPLGHQVSQRESLGLCHSAMAVTLHLLVCPIRITYSAPPPLTAKAVQQTTCTPESFTATPGVLLPPAAALLYRTVLV